MNISSRAQILIFLGFTALFSYAFIARGFWPVVVMLVPGAVAIACSYTFKNEHPAEELGFAHRPSKSELLLAYAVPAGAALLILLVTVGIGTAQFQFLWNAALVNRLVFAPTLGVLVAGIFALGEELGWRGFLHARLKEINFPRPYLLTGCIWAAWHYPQMTTHTPAQLALFTISVISFSIFLGQLRESSGSLWPVVLAHAVHNTWIQGIYPQFVRAGAIDRYYGGETGVVLAIIYLSFAIFLQKKPLDSWLAKN